MTITVSCPSCSTSFPVDPAKIPPRGVNARCSACGSVFFVDKPADADARAETAPAPEPTGPVTEAATAPEGEIPSESSVEAPAAEAAGEEEAAEEDASEEEASAPSPWGGPATEAPGTEAGDTGATVPSPWDAPHEEAEPPARDATAEDDEGSVAAPVEPEAVEEEELPEWEAEAPPVAEEEEPAEWEAEAPPVAEEEELPEWEAEAPPVAEEEELPEWEREAPPVAEEEEPAEWEAEAPPVAEEEERAGQEAPEGDEAPIEPRWGGDEPAAPELATPVAEEEPADDFERTAWDAGEELPAEADEEVAEIPTDEWVIEREPEIDSDETVHVEPLEHVEPDMAGAAEEVEPEAPAPAPGDASAPPEYDEGWPEVDLAPDLDVEPEEPHAEASSEPLVTGGFDSDDQEGTVATTEVDEEAPSETPSAPDEPSIAEPEEAVPPEESAEQEPTPGAPHPDVAAAAEAHDLRGGRAPETLSAPAEAPRGFQMGRRDPHEKAQRLARVLVSDMIMYNPERHSRALDQGTLEADFDDEIRKSWAEYVTQIGSDLATETTYFTDALNDILARGERVFHGPPSD